MDKLKKKKTLVIILGLAGILFIFGTIFITIISKSDINLVKEYINTFMDNIINNKIDYLEVLKETLISNIFFIILIWLLGMSVIGIPVNLFFYFFKAFSLGFALSSFILTYKTKGLLFSSLYLFPNEIVKFLAYTLIVSNSIKVSKKLINSIIKKETINFNKLINRYAKILGITLIIIIITSLYEVYAIPFIFNKLSFLIK